jgi:hypothetical protein
MRNKIQNFKTPSHSPYTRLWKWVPSFVVYKFPSPKLQHYTVIQGMFTRLTNKHVIWDGTTPTATGISFVLNVNEDEIFMECRGVADRVFISWYICQILFLQKYITEPILQVQYTRLYITTPHTSYTLTIRLLMSYMYIWSTYYWCF